MTLDVELEWEYFHTIFLSISSKHVPTEKFRISTRDNHWFSESLSKLICLRNKSKAQVQFSNTDGWTTFRTLTEPTLPLKFWKLIKSLSDTHVASSLPEPDLPPWSVSLINTLLILGPYLTAQM